MTQFQKPVGSGLAGLLVRLWRHLSVRRQRQFGLLLSLMVVSALAEVISLGAVLPFIGVLAAPATVFKHTMVANAARVLGITSADELVMPITVAFAGVAILAGAIRTLLLWVSVRLAFAGGADLSTEAYRRTLYQPYQVHIARNSSGVISAITKKVGGSVNLLFHLLNLLSSALVLVAVTLALIAIDPLVAIVAIAGFGASYGLISWAARKRLRQNSSRIAEEQTQVFKALQEGLGGIRDVLLDGTQPLYSRLYSDADQPLRWAQGNNEFIAASPRFAMETIGIVLIAALAYGMNRQAGGIAGALPMLGALALGSQRVLPALQLIYSSWAGIASNQASLADSLEMLEQPLPPDMEQPLPEPLRFDHSIAFDSVRFRYGSEGPWVLDGLNLAIPRGARVGFVGTTGSGKSTTLDLLMGLLTPSAGSILVDGQPLSGTRLRAWQRALAHVPQSIYLPDATIAENVAFGVPRAEIDLPRVRQAARQAQIADFIESRPEGYDALVGERGVRLSGGQRQRIGIARALYKQASVLVFDEATSALDTATEQSVMEAIKSLDRGLTILIIAHRLTTVRDCDFIVELEHGRVTAQGTYDQLLASSPNFRRAGHAAGV